MQVKGGFVCLEEDVEYSIGTLTAFEREITSNNPAFREKALKQILVDRMKERSIRETRDISCHRLVKSCVAPTWPSYRLENIELSRKGLPGTCW